MVEGRAKHFRSTRNIVDADGIHDPSHAIHVAGKLKPDDWKGREGVELEIEDAADPRISRA